ncbi:MAG: hypothetical protein KC646_15740 [Candidatus Cloacimonetes bacterium]|nr:hypothetical protein [Candidatus Cloacimonadota bacterium]
MPKINPELTFNKVLALINLFGLIYFSKILYLHENLSTAQYFFVAFLPLIVTTSLYWYNRYFIATGLLTCYCLLLLAPKGCPPFDHNARYNTTKNNLSSIKSAIQLYHVRQSKFPQTTVSGDTKTTLDNKKTLEAILSNTGDHGDGTEYIQGAVPAELISSEMGDNYVCIIQTKIEYLSDQSHRQNCINSKIPNAIGKTVGGYLYYPQEGLIRLNFKVNQNDLQMGQQNNVGDLFKDWKEWSTKNPDLDQDYPVRW